MSVLPSNLSVTRARPREEMQGIWRKLAVLRNSGNPLDLLMQLARRRDGCLELQDQSQRIFLFTAVDHFKHVLATNSANYGKYLDGMKPIFGGSMITLDGAPWQKMRTVQQPAFHPNMICGYVPHFLAAIGSRMDKWAEFGEAAGPVDICEETWALAADMTCRALFDRETPFDPQIVFRAVKSFTSVTNHESVRLRCVDDQLARDGGSVIAQATRTWVDLPRTILDAAPIQERARTLLGFIQEAAADLETSEFGQQQVLDEIKQYIWAGTETTALLLAWALYLTSVHTEVAERVRQETSEVFDDREPTPADYSKLAYTRNVIQETMRMYPPIWSLTRTAEADDVIGSHEVKRGDTMVLCTYAAHHDPRYWDNPDRFDPGRFTAERAKARQPYSYLPFGGGKRACIGGAMSQVETVLALALFLRDFDLEYAGENPAAINLTVTLSPKNGLPMRIRRRSRPRTARTPSFSRTVVNRATCPFDPSLSRGAIDGGQP
jgi:cytochrome P450